MQVSKTEQYVNGDKLRKEQKLKSYQHILHNIKKQVIIIITIVMKISAKK